MANALFSRAFILGLASSVSLGALQASAEAPTNFGSWGGHRPSLQNMALPAAQPAAVNNPNFAPAFAAGRTHAIPAVNSFGGQTHLHQSPAPYAGINFNLASPQATFLAGNLGNFNTLVIDVGGRQEIVNLNTRLTAAEFVAAQQILNCGTQSIEIGSNGAARGGSLILNDSMMSSINNSISGGVASMAVARGVQVVDALANLSLPGRFINYGSVSAAAHTAGQTDSISADIIHNGYGASIASYTGSGPFVGADIALNATSALTNNGLISSAQNLTINAPVINNAGTILAGQVINVTGSSGLDVSGKGSWQANVINFAGGGGDIFVRDAALMANQVTFDAGSGSVYASPGLVTGAVDANGYCVHINALAGDLNLGKIDASGDPIFTAQQDILINGAITSTNGFPLTLIAGRDILSSTGNTGLVTTKAGAAGGQINLVAGAAFTPFVDAPPPVGSVVSVKVTGASATGGNINLINTNNIASIDAGGSGSGDGGALTFVAYADGSGARGNVSVPSGVMINTKSASANGGSVTIIAGGASANLGAIDASGGLGAKGGNVSLSMAQPSGTVTFDKDGAITSGAFKAGAVSSASALTLGAVTTTGGNVVIKSDTLTVSGPIKADGLAGLAGVVGLAGKPGGAGGTGGRGGDITINVIGGFNLLGAASDITSIGGVGGKGANAAAVMSGAGGAGGAGGTGGAGGKITISATAGDIQLAASILSRGGAGGAAGTGAAGGNAATATAGGSAGGAGGKGGSGGAGGIITISTGSNNNILTDGDIRSLGGAGVAGGTAGVGGNAGSTSGTAGVGGAGGAGGAGGGAANVSISAKTGTITLGFNNSVSIGSFGNNGGKGATGGGGGLAGTSGTGGAGGVGGAGGAAGAPGNVSFSVSGGTIKSMVSSSFGLAGGSGGNGGDGGKGGNAVNGKGGKGGVGGAGGNNVKVGALTIKSNGGNIDLLNNSILLSQGSENLTAAGTGGKGGAGGDVTPTMSTTTAPRGGDGGSGGAAGKGSAGGTITVNSKGAAITGSVTIGSLDASASDAGNGGGGGTGGIGQAMAAGGGKGGVGVTGGAGAVGGKISVTGAKTVIGTFAVTGSQASGSGGNGGLGGDAMATGIVGNGGAGGNAGAAGAGGAFTAMTLGDLTIINGGAADGTYSMGVGGKGGDAGDGKSGGSGANGGNGVAGARGGTVSLTATGTAAVPVSITVGGTIFANGSAATNMAKPSGGAGRIGNGGNGGKSNSTGNGGTVTVNAKIGTIQLTGVDVSGGIQRSNGGDGGKVNGATTITATSVAGGNGGNGGISGGSGKGGTITISATTVAGAPVFGSVVASKLSADGGRIEGIGGTGAAGADGGKGGGKGGSGGAQMAAGAGGTINVTAGNTMMGFDISAKGGNNFGFGNSGGAGGMALVGTSGAGGNSGAGGAGGAGGKINISSVNSMVLDQTMGNVTVAGGYSSGNKDGGAGGGRTTSTLYATSTAAPGAAGKAGSNAVSGGNGGTITVKTTKGTIIANGLVADGGDGGSGSGFGGGAGGAGGTAGKLATGTSGNGLAGAIGAVGSKGGNGGTINVTAGGGQTITSNAISANGNFGGDGGNGGAGGSASMTGLKGGAGGAGAVMGASGAGGKVSLKVSGAGTITVTDPQARGGNNDENLYHNQGGTGGKGGNVTLAGATAGVGGAGGAGGQSGNGGSVTFTTGGMSTLFVTGKVYADSLRGGDGGDGGDAGTGGVTGIAGGVGGLQANGGKGGKVIINPLNAAIPTIDVSDGTPGIPGSNGMSN